MPVSFIPDPHKGPGYGILLISPMQCDTAPTFALTNASTRQCLSPTGWQSAEVFLEPDAWDCTNEQLRLAVGPHVVDNLDSLDMYKLQLKDDAGNIISYGLAIDDIVQSSMAGGQGLATAVAATPKVEPAPEPIVPEPQPEPETEPEPQAMPEVEMAPEQPAKKNFLPLILGIVILCALLGAGLWWYLQKQTPVAEENTTQTEESAANTDEQASEEKAEQQEEQSSEAKAEEQAKETEQKPTAPQSQEQNEQGAASTAEQIRPMDSARALLRANDTGEKSQSLATELRSKAPDDAAAQDAVFLLFEDAAQKGVSSAMSELAGYYDPSSTAPKGSISPDVEQAYTWYQKAQQSGDAKAQEHLARLKSWAEEEAQKGNSEAKKLLNLWK